MKGLEILRNIKPQSAIRLKCLSHAQFSLNIISYIQMVFSQFSRNPRLKYYFRNPLSQTSMHIYINAYKLLHIRIMFDDSNRI